jgi:hypothetical protein
MAYLAVDEIGFENMFHQKPIRKNSVKPGFGYWEDIITYQEIRQYTTHAEDYSIHLPKGTIKKLIGKDITWKDEPVLLT